MLVSSNNFIIKSNKKLLIKSKYLIGLKTKNLKSETSKIFDIKKAI